MLNWLRVFKLKWVFEGLISWMRSIALLLGCARIKSWEKSQDSGSLNPTYFLRQAGMPILPHSWFPSWAGTGRDTYPTLFMISTPVG
jgi:hypothetical protein